MSNQISVVSDECKATIEEMSPHQKLVAIEELTTNIQALRTLIASSSQMKADMLDEGEVAHINSMGNEAQSMLYKLSEKVDLLRASLNLPKR